MNPPVAAVVLASRGGARLEAALGSVAWAPERIVLDPARRLDGRPLPTGVRRGHNLAEAWAPWLLLLEEHESVPPELAARIAETVAAPGRFAAFRIGIEVHAFGATFRPPGAPVRLVRSPGARVDLGRGVVTELRPAGGEVGRLSDRLVAQAADSLAAAVENLDADAATLAALLARRRVRPGLRHLVLPPLAAAFRPLAARGSWRRVRLRWILCVLEGYRALLAWAKVWELRLAEASTPR
jgi:hypothetical protein